MNVLLVNVPSRKGKEGFILPLGLLYVGKALRGGAGRVEIK
jgi:hypothetical protein